MELHMSAGGTDYLPKAERFISCWHKMKCPEGVTAKSLTTAATVEGFSRGMCCTLGWVSPLGAQTWTVCAVLFSVLAQGMVMGFTSDLLPALRAPDSPIQTDLASESWLVGSIGISIIFSAAYSSFFMYYFGRRVAYIVSVIPGVLGMVIIYLATSISALIFGRILGGLSVGSTANLGVIIIGEYTSPKNRGMFLNLKTAFLYLGSTISHIMGHLLHWRTVAILTVIPYVLTLIIVCTWPESPVWLAFRERFGDCERSFFWLRGRSDETQVEFGLMIKAQQHRLSSSKTNSLLDEITRILRKFNRKDFLKPIFICLICAVLVESTGRHIFPSYALQIITEMSHDSSNSFKYTLSIDLILTTSAMFSSVLVRVMRRRTLLFASGISTLIVLFIMCTYLYLVSENIVYNQPLIPVGMFVFYLILVNLGCVPISLALTGEVIPFEHRGVIMTIVGASFGLCIMMGLKATPYLLFYCEIYGTFAVFGAVMGISLIAMYIFLPETKNRTLQEIEYFFNHGEFRDVGIEEAKMIS